MEQGKPQIEIWLEEGLASYSQGDPARALEAWQKILDVDPGHGLAQQYVAYVRQVYRVDHVAADQTSPADTVVTPDQPTDVAHDDAARVGDAPAAPGAGRLASAAYDAATPGARARDEPAPPSAEAPKTEELRLGAAPAAAAASSLGAAPDPSPPPSAGGSSWMDLVDSSFDVAVSRQVTAPPTQRPMAAQAAAPGGEKARKSDPNPWLPKTAAETQRGIAALDGAPKPAAPPASSAAAGFADVSATLPLPPRTPPPAAQPVPAASAPGAPVVAPPASAPLPTSSSADTSGALAPLPTTDPLPDLPPLASANGAPAIAPRAEPLAAASAPPPSPAPPTLLHPVKEEPDPWEVHAPGGAAPLPPAASAVPPASLPQSQPWGAKTPPPVDPTFDPWAGDSLPPAAPPNPWIISPPKLDIPKTSDVEIPPAHLLAIAATHSPAPSAAPPPAAPSMPSPEAPLPTPAGPQAATSAAAPHDTLAEPEARSVVAPPTPPPPVPVWKRTAVEEVGSYRVAGGARVEAAPAAPSAPPAPPRGTVTPPAPPAASFLSPPGSAGGIEERVARQSRRFDNYDAPAPSATTAAQPSTSQPAAPGPTAAPATATPPVVSSHVPVHPQGKPAAAEGSSPWDDDGGVAVDLDIEVQSSPFDDLMKSAPPVAAAAQPPSPALAAPVDESDELMRGARELFELGDFSGSLELVDKVLRKNPTHEGALAYLKKNETTLLKMYESKLGDLRRSPRQLMPPDEVIWINLHHKAGFLLAQVDGSLSYEDLLEVSGMPRFDTMRILHDLVQQGVIG